MINLQLANDRITSTDIGGFDPGACVPRIPFRIALDRISQQSFLAGASSADETSDTRSVFRNPAPV